MPLQSAKVTLYNFLSLYFKLGLSSNVLLPVGNDDLFGDLLLPSNQHSLAYALKKKNEWEEDGL